MRMLKYCLQNKFINERLTPFVIFVDFHVVRSQWVILKQIKLFRYAKRIFRNLVELLNNGNYGTNQIYVFQKFEPMNIGKK